ncbi:MAG: hypothetical protein LQ337_001101 [Flavoplaca oasis]|nr:MAG: hypothetical protein LQ337_001101 [Flavoplaca oasis]
MSGLFLSHERQNIMPPIPPPLSMEPPTSMDRNGAAYPTPSSASATVPTTLPRSPQEPKPTHTIEDGRRYRCGKLSGMSQIDTSFYVLTVDLWNAEGTKEVNLVRHSQTSPSISAATSTSYPPPTMIQNPFGLPTHGLPTQNSYLPGNAYAPAAHQAYSNQHQQLYAAPSQGYQSNPYQQSIFHGNQYTRMSQQQAQEQAYYMTPSNPTVASGYQPPHMAQYQHHLGIPMQLPRTAVDPTASTPTPPGMFTRNLIGSLGVSAFKLTDCDNAIGIWFILQDLSVRTEGNFRYSPLLLSISFLY